MILEQFNDLSSFKPTEKSIICTLVNQINNLDQLTIGMLAKETYTSNATIIRFCRKFGCDGFRDFKIKLIKEVNSQYSELISVDANKPFQPADSISSIGKNIAELMKKYLDDTFQNLTEDTIRKTVSTIEKSSRLFIFARGDSFITARAFQNKVMKINKYVILADEYHESAFNIRNCTKNDCVMFITYSGQHNDYNSFITILKSLQIPTIVLTAYPKTTLAKNCDILILVPQGEGIDSKIATFTSQLSFEYILNIIYSILFEHNYIVNYNQKLIKDRYVNKMLSGGLNIK